MKLPEVIWFWPALVSSGGFIHLFCYIFFFSQASLKILAALEIQHEVLSLITEQHCPLLVAHGKLSLMLLGPH